MAQLSIWLPDWKSDVQGKRYALPNTRIMLHHPSGSARGQASDIHSEARELMRLRNYVNRVLSQATGKPIEKVSTGELPCMQWRALFMPYIASFCQHKNISLQ